MAVGLFTAAAPAPNTAAINKQVNFQGRLTDSAGNIVGDGDYNMEFKLHNHATNTGGGQGTCSGSCLWIETRTSTNKVTVSRGLFSIQLGEVASLAGVDFAQDPIYLSVRIGGTGTASWDSEMTPRHRLGAAPQAIEADHAATADSATTATTATNATNADNADTLDGQHGSYYQNANNLNAGTLADGRLSSNVALQNVANNFTQSQTISAAGGKTTLALTNTGANTGLTIGGDTNLFRDAANTLKTDGFLYAGEEIRAADGQSARIRLGGLGPSGEAAVIFGSDDDTNLYRSAANTLKTQDSFHVSRDSTAAFQVQNASGTPLFTADTTNSEIEIAGDLYTEGLGISDWFWSSTALYSAEKINANDGGPGEVEIGNVGPGSVAAILFEQDSNIYRSAANVLQTNSLFVFDNEAADPTGVNGGIYYNTTNDKFRCYQNSAWLDCVGAGAGSGTLQDAYDASGTPATITTTSDTKDIIFKSGTGFNSTTAFQVQNAAGSNILTVDTTNSRIGINDSSPDDALDITHSIAHGGITLNRDSAGSRKSQITFQQQGTERWSIGSDLNNNNNQDFFIWDADAGASRFLIDNAGQVSLGAGDTPESKLHVRTSGDTTDTVLRLDNGASTASSADSAIHFREHSGGSYNSGYNFGYDAEFNDLYLEALNGGTLTRTWEVERATGATTFQSITNNAAAFQVQNASGSSAFSVDTNSGSYAIAQVGGSGYDNSELTLTNGGSAAWGLGSDDASAAGSNAFYVYNYNNSSYAFMIDSGGAALFRDTSTTAFRVQDATGSRDVFTVDTSNSDIYIDDGGGVTGTSQAFFNNRASIGYDGSTQDAFLRGATDKGIKFYVDDTLEALDLDEDGTATFSGNTVVQGTLDVNDATTVSTDSKTAFQIQNASGTSAFVADTNNSIIRPDTRASSTLSLTRTATAVDSTNDVGQYTSTVIGTDGLPTIAYYDVTNADLRIARCDDLDCTSASSAAVATTGDVGKYLAMTLGTDKYPIISYYDATNGDLKVLKCGNDACSSGNTTTTLDSTGDVGQYTSITKTSTGLPRIAYYDVTNADLKLASCSTTDCTSSSLSTVDSTGDVGQYASIMLTDGGTSNVLISYYDATNGNLKTAYSFFGFTITTVDSTGDVGQHTSIAPGTDGLPLISYYDVTNGDLKAADCGDVACSTGNTISTAYSTGDIGKYTSLKRMPGGSSMLLSYYDVTNGDLKTCTSITFCTTFGGEETPDSTGDVGQYTAVAVGSDNLPLVSYYDVTNGDLKIVKCANTACDASTTTGFGGGVTLGTAGSSFQSIYFDTLNLGNEDAAVRLDASGDFTANGLTAESDGTVSTGDLTVQDTINVLDTNGDWTFQTSSSGTANFRSTTNSTGAFLVRNAASTMVFRVDTTNGRVGVGSSAPSDTLDVDGDVRVGTGTTGCVKDADATVIAGTCSSDIRLKKNIEKNESVLDSFGQLGVVNYDWRADEFPDYSLGTARQTGLVAQDVEALFPQLVHTDENGYKTLDYTGLGILNIQATTELDAKTDDLEERVSALEDIQGGDSTFETLAAASATVDELTVEKLAIVGELIVEGDARVKGDLKVDGSLEIGADERGNNVSVEEGRDYLQIAFEESRANTDYNVQITPNWLTVTAVTEKTAGGFTVRFKDPAPAGATFDWLVVE